MPFKFPDQNPYTKTGNDSTGDFLLWLEDVRISIEDMQDMLRAYMGDADGVVADATFGVTAGLVLAISPPSMSLFISPGRFIANKIPLRIASGSTQAFTAPTTNDRIDTIVASIPDRAFVVYTGTESGSPTAPAAGDGEVLLAHIYMRPGMTEINDEDISPNDQGYITDSRTFVNA